MSSNSSKESVRAMDRVDLTNRQIGVYRILHRLGSGGMSDVYLAFHENLHRHVAIKVMRMDLASSPEHVKRFMQEARSAASMMHPNIVQVYDVGEHQNMQYIAQEYIAGCTLRDYIQRVGALGINETISILMQVSAALSKSASIGIVHRDIKPDNILLTPDGEVKVADFGLSRAHTNKEHLTEVGIALGTPTYMSPEQVQGQQVDIRSDLYSLGVTAYHMLAGRPPFEGETALALAVQHVQNKPQDLAKLRPDLPEKLVGIVHRLLEKKVENRLVSANELHRALRDVAEGLPAPMPTDRPLPLPNVVVDAVEVGEHTSALDKAALKQKLIKSERKRRVLKAYGILAAMILAGCTAYFVVVSRPLKKLLPDLTPAQLGIDRKNTAREQYVLALLKDTPAYWAAVELYFPPDSSSVAESYCMKAWLHLAWNSLTREKPEEAERYLAKIVDRSSSDPVIEVLYHATRYWQAILDSNLATSATKESDLFRMKYSGLSQDQQRIVRETLPLQTRALMDSTWNVRDRTLSNPLLKAYAIAVIEPQIGHTR